MEYMESYESWDKTVKEAIKQFRKTPQSTDYNYAWNENKFDFLSVKKKCFQEKRDVVFAIDGSRHVSDEMFSRALEVVLNITSGMDISPSLIHVGLVQFSNYINTRIEFGLNQYTKMYKVKQSLSNIIRANGHEADVELVVDVIDKEVSEYMSQTH